MELNEVLNKRKSVREYNGKAVEREKLEQIVEASQLAPSWKNSQTARYYVVQSDEVLERVKSAMSDLNRKKVENCPVLIVTTYVANRAGFDKEGNPDNEVGNGWGCYDLGLANMNLLLKAAELGLSTLIMGLRDADELAKILDIPETENVMAVIAVGYSEADPERPKRKPLGDIAKFV